MLEALVFVEVDDAFAIAGEDFGDGRNGEVFQGDVGAGCFDDDFMCADTGKLVIQSDGHGFERALDAHGGIAIGDDADAPAGLVGFGLFLPDRENLGGREAFVALGEGIEGRTLQDGRQEILRSALTFRGEDNPGVVEGIAAEFRRHAWGSKSGGCFYATPSS